MGLELVQLLLKLFIWRRVRGQGQGIQSIVYNRIFEEVDIIESYGIVYVLNVLYYLDFRVDVYGIFVQEGYVMGIYDVGCCFWFVGKVLNLMLLIVLVGYFGKFVLI